MAIVSKISHTTDEIKWLVPMFQALESVIGHFTRWNEEPPYWYNEAASVSLLVAAASQRNYIAISDYRRYKYHKGNDSKGRCDLLVGRGNLWLEAEAKQSYLRMGAGPHYLTKGLQKACNDAKKLWRTKRRAGLLFTILSLSKEQAKTFNLSQFTNVLDGAKGKADICWYWYDTRCMQPLYKDVDNDRYYPGFAILLKKC